VDATTGATTATKMGTGTVMKNRDHRDHGDEGHRR